MHEIEIMKKLDHPNVIKLYEIINNEKSDKMYIGIRSIYNFWIFSWFYFIYYLCWIFKVVDYVCKGEILKWDEKKEHFIPILELAN